MKNNPVITSELPALRKQARNNNEHVAIAATNSADRFEVVNSRGTPEALPTSCGLDELWGITSNQGQMRFRLFVNEHVEVPVC
jgi:hypothetical protein